MDLDKKWRFHYPLIIISYMALLPLYFLGKVFGKLRHLGVSLSLFGQSLGIESSQEIT